MADILPELRLTELEVPFLLEISNDNGSIVTIGHDGIVTIHQDGGEKEAAKRFYESLQFEGVNLYQKIEKLEQQIERYKNDKR